MSENIFDILSYLTVKKVPWSKLSDEAKKEVSPYMLNRWLSMNSDFIELVDALQQYTVGSLSANMVYELYYHILPKQKSYSKYIKSKKQDKFPIELVNCISSYLSCSVKEAEENLDILGDLEYDVFATGILSMYAYSEKDIKKIISGKSK